MNITGSLRVDPNQGWCRVVPSSSFAGDSTANKRAIESTDVKILANFDTSKT